MYGVRWVGSCGVGLPIGLLKLVLGRESRNLIRAALGVHGVCEAWSAGFVGSRRVQCLLNDFFCLLSAVATLGRGSQLMAHLSE